MNQNNEATATAVAPRGSANARRVYEQLAEQFNDKTEKCFEKIHWLGLPNDYESGQTIGYKRGQNTIVLTVTLRELKVPPEAGRMFAWFVSAYTVRNVSQKLVKWSSYTRKDKLYIRVLAEAILLSVGADKISIEFKNNTLQGFKEASKEDVDLIYVAWQEKVETAEKVIAEQVEKPKRKRVSKKKSVAETATQEENGTN